MEHQSITTAAAHGSSKKHTRSRGRAKKAQDPYASAYGVVPFLLLRRRPWTLTQNLDEARVGEHVHLFGEVRSVLLLSNTEALVVLLDRSSTVGCVVTAGSHVGVTTRMVRFAVTLPRATAIDVEGVVSQPEDGKPLIPTTRWVEIQVTKLHSIASARAATPQVAKSQRPCISMTPSVKPEENVTERTGEVERSGQVCLNNVSSPCSSYAKQFQISMEHQSITTAAAHGSSKKHTRSRGRAKKAQDPYASAYGVVPFLLLRRRPWTLTQNLDETRVGEHVHLFGEVRSVLLLSNTEALVVLLDRSSTVGCVVTAGSHEGVTTRMVRFAITLPQVTAIDVEGVVSLPEDGKPLIPTTQWVEIQVTKLHSIARAHAATPQVAKSQRPCVSMTPSVPSVKMEENVMERKSEVENTEQV